MADDGDGDGGFLVLLPDDDRASPSQLQLPPPPPRPLVEYRLMEDDPSPRRDGEARGRSRSRSDDGVGWRQHPPQHKRPRRGDDWAGKGRRRPPRDRRYGQGGGGGGGGGGFMRHRAPDYHDSGCGASSSAQDTTQRKGLMTYKQFIQALEDDVSPAEAESRYKEYRTAYITGQKHAYFDLHKNESWLKDQYHPTNLLSVIERRNKFCKDTSKNFFLDLRSGVLDIGPGLTAGAASKSGNSNDGSSEDDKDYGFKRKRHGRSPAKDPEPHSVAPMGHPVSSQYRRIKIDIDQTLALVQKLDAEKGIVGNILSTGDHGKLDDDRMRVGSMGPVVLIRGLATVKGLEGVELLDTLLTYLWRVHGVDYYGISEMKDPKGLRHVRADKKSANTFSISADDWEKKLDSFWQERLTNDKDPLAVLTDRDRIDAATDEILESYVRKTEDDNYGWKYGCGAKECSKIFHAPEFVQKHLSLKHPDLVSVLTSRVLEDIYFQNYMNDPNAPGGIPVMQQSAPDITRWRCDEQMFDASIVHEFPIPHVLIPVPGAGPLGPFVPALPEIAMQMTGEQGPPRPNVPLHGKKPVMLEPVIPMRPFYRPDPRILRSYNDLDAPDEAATVIDYRSSLGVSCYTG